MTQTLAMPLPGKALLLAAAARRDWRGVLGLAPGATLTPAEARRIRVAVHPDKGGDPEVAAFVGQAIDKLVTATPFPTYDFEREERERREYWERADREYAEERRRVEEEQRRREEEERQRLKRQHEEEQERKWKIRRLNNQRARRAAARPDPDATKATIRGLVEHCTAEEASPVDAIKRALNIGQAALVAVGLTSAARRQRGSGRERVYYFVWEGGPIRVRSASTS